MLKIHVYYIIYYSASCVVQIASCTLVGIGMIPFITFDADVPFS